MRVLLMEDHPLIAADLVEQLETAGYVVIGPAQSVSRTLDLIQTERFDVAILDFDLTSGKPTQVVEALQIRRTPFVVLSYRSQAPEIDGLAGVTWLTKPHKSDELLAALALRQTGARRS
jgi:DNA-binding response OmpR family regulator